MIDESRINREKYADIYIAATNEAFVMQFAYSEEKGDYIMLKNIPAPMSQSQCKEVWEEFQVVSMILQYALRVRRIVDDVRGYSN